MKKIPKDDRGPETDKRAPSEKAQRLSVQAIFDKLDAGGAADFAIERDQTPLQQRDWF